MTHDEMIAVITAHRDGKEIQVKRKDGVSTFGPLWPNPLFDFAAYDYRVKPEPIVRYAAVDPKGYVYEYDASETAINIFVSTRTHLNLRKVKFVEEL